MNTGGEAAEQIVRMSLNGVEMAAKISGAGAKHLAILLYTILSQREKTSGKARLGYANSADGTVIYHAWIDVYTPKIGWITNAIEFNGETWSLIDLTFIIYWQAEHRSS
jgi:hypothetical protein